MQVAGRSGREALARTEGQVMRWETVLTFWRRRRLRPEACATGRSISSPVSLNNANESPLVRKGIMAGIPADELFLWIYVIALSAIAATGTIGTYNVSARINAAKDRELQPVQSVTRAQIEAAMADATQASARTAELVKANGELQLELQEEKDALIAMPQRFEPR